MFVDEKGWIKSFFASFLDTSDGIACDDFNTIMFGCDVNLLAPIFALTACDAHPYFVGMSETLNNNAKGWVSHRCQQQLAGSWVDPS